MDTTRNKTSRAERELLLQLRLLLTNIAILTKSKHGNTSYLSQSRPRHGKGSLGFSRPGLSAPQPASWSHHFFLQNNTKQDYGPYQTRFQLFRKTPFHISMPGCLCFAALYLVTLEVTGCLSCSRESGPGLAGDGKTVELGLNIVSRIILLK